MPGSKATSPALANARVCRDCGRTVPPEQAYCHACGSSDLESDPARLSPAANRPSLRDAILDTRLRAVFGPGSPRG